MILKNKACGMWQEVTMAYLKVAYQYWLGEMKEIHGNSHDNWPLTQDSN
jgi:hypothetical protein